MLRIQSPLSDQVERLIHDTIGCCIRVHRELGPGLFERIYSRAVCIELEAAAIPFEQEKHYVVTYRGENISDQYLDLVVGNQIVLELKAVEDLAPIHHKADPELHADREPARWTPCEFQRGNPSGRPQPKDPVTNCSFS